MELLVATWTLRLALVAAAAVGGISYSAGTPAVESVDRAIAAAFVFTLFGRLLVGWLEPPEQRLARLRRRRQRQRDGSRDKDSSVKKGRGAPEAAPAGSTVHTA